MLRLWRRWDFFHAHEAQLVSTLSSFLRAECINEGNSTTSTMILSKLLAFGITQTFLL